MNHSTPIKRASIATLIGLSLMAGNVTAQTTNPSHRSDSPQPRARVAQNRVTPRHAFGAAGFEHRTAATDNAVRQQRAAGTNAIDESVNRSTIGEAIDPRMIKYQSSFVSTPY